MASIQFGTYTPRPIKEEKEVEEIFKIEYYVTKEGEIKEKEVGIATRLSNFIFDEEDKEYDTLYNEDNSKKIDVKKGILAKIQSGTVSNMPYHAFLVEDDAHAKDVFEFLAVNTDVEWSRIRYSNNGKTNNILATSHQKATESYAASKVPALLEKGYNINHTHSHPPIKDSNNAFVKTNPKPSGYPPKKDSEKDSGDRAFYNYLVNKENEVYERKESFGQYILSVYDVVGDQYFYFDHEVRKGEYVIIEF